MGQAVPGTLSAEGGLSVVTNVEITNCGVLDLGRSTPDSRAAKDDLTLRGEVW